MGATTTRTEQPNPTTANTLCELLRHPLRVRILEVANVRPISPAQFVDEGLEPSGVDFPDRKRALTNVSYHFNQLKKAGALELDREVRRRGAVETVYRGIKQVAYTQEEFDQLPIAERRMLSRVGVQSLVAVADGAMRADTFDSRTDRWFGWIAMELDDKGFKTIGNLLDGFLPLVERAQAEAKARLAEGESEPIHAAYAGLLFETPPPPVQCGGPSPH